MGERLFAALRAGADIEDEIMKRREEIARRLAPFDAVHALGHVVMREMALNPETYSESEHPGAAHVVELATAVLLARPSRAGERAVTPMIDATTVGPVCELLREAVFLEGLRRYDTAGALGDDPFGGARGRAATHAQQWGAGSLALEARSAALTSDDSPSSRALKKVNQALMREERLLTTRQGIPGRPWFQHQIYAPGVNTGYAAQFLPGIRDALDAGDAATVAKYRDLLLDSLRRVTATAWRASGRSAASSARKRRFATRSTAAAAAAARRSARASANDIPAP